MKFALKLEKFRSIDRIIGVLLVAFLVVEGFFLWLMVFPDAQPQVEYPDGLVREGIYGTRQIAMEQFIETAEAKRRQERWQAFGDELAERFAGQDFAIAFIDPNNPEMKLQVNADQEFIAASTYKILAAYAMLNAGNAPDCLDDMIIYSDNDCPLSYLARYGWSRLTQDARDVGAVQSWFVDSTHTTANDLALILWQIYDGSLLSEADNNRLLDDMKTQIFRNGIPAGIPEAEVADKVGFLDGLLHDAGIIYSPKGDYILVILTDGYSWSAIADIAAEIYEQI
jgi:beta-lactamase class A